MIFKVRKASDLTNEQGLYEYDELDVEEIGDLYNYLIDHGNGCKSVIIRFDHNPNEWVLDSDSDWHDGEINELIIYDDYVE